MENAAVLTLAGLCLGIALTGLLAVALRHGKRRERLSLGLVYIAFIGMIALPIVKAFAGIALINYMPLLLVMLLALPPAFYHHIAARTARTTLPSMLSCSHPMLAGPISGYSMRMCRVIR